MHSILSLLTSTKGSCINDSVSGACGSTSSKVVVAATTAGKASQPCRMAALSDAMLLLEVTSLLLGAAGLGCTASCAELLLAALLGLLLPASDDDLRHRLKKLLPPLLLYGCTAGCVGAAADSCTHCC